MQSVRRSHRQTRSLAFALIMCVAGDLSGLAAAKPILAQAAQPGSGVVSLPPGTLVGDQTDPRFNRLLLRATIQLASGDVQQLPAPFRNVASKFSLTIMAAVTRQDDQSYQLDEVGMGFSVADGARRLIVTSETAAGLGVDLGFIERQVLTQNQTKLKPPRVLLRTTTLVLFDVDGLLFVNGRHVDRVYRSLVWVHPVTGRLAMASWALVPVRDPAAATMTVESSKPLRLIAAGTLEDRRVHVDGDEFFLGIPGERAFALEDLPPGLSIPWTPARREALSKTTYDANSLPELLAQLNEVVPPPS